MELTDQPTKITAQAIGGPSQGRWITGDPTKTLNVVPATARGIIRYDWRKASDGTWLPESYRLWHYQPPGWLIKVPFWLHTDLIVNDGTKAGVPAPVVAFTWVMDIPGHQRYEAQNIPAVGRPRKVAW